MYYFIGTLIVLGVAVLVHELGHFIVARRNGVRVEEFCIGFPPRIFKFKKGETQYSIGIIPVGGFVKMAGDDAESVSGKSDEFFSKSVPARIRIAFAGPLANLVCAYVCVVAYLMTGGIQIPMHAPVLGTPEDMGLYREIGIEPGDRVTEFGGRPLETYNALVERMRTNDTWPVTMVLDRKGERREIRMDSEQARQFDTTAFPLVLPVISRVVPGGPAARSGLEAGDRVTEINGRLITEWTQLHTAVSKSAGDTLVLGVARAGKTLTVTVVPETQRQQKMDGEIEKVGRIGIQSSVETVTRSFGLWESLKVAFGMLYQFIAMFLDVLWRLVTGGLSVKMLAGPVGIAQIAGDSLKQGGHPFLMFLGMINANLGFVNLIPFFLITDGGLILLFCIEALRRRKMTLKSLERWNAVGWAMVLTLLLMATYNDLMLRLELGDKLSRGWSALKNIF